MPSLMMTGFEPGRADINAASLGVLRKPLSPTVLMQAANAVSGLLQGVPVSAPRGLELSDHGMTHRSAHDPDEPR